MANYFVFFRTWRHFTDQFSFDDFNSLSDKEIYDAIKSHALNWLRDNKAEVKGYLRRKKTRLKKAIEKRRRGFSEDPTKTTSIHSNPLATRGLLDTIRGSRTNDIAFRIACIAGWVDSSLPTFGDFSPSLMLVVYYGDRNTAESVLEILKDQLSIPDYADFNLRFGCISADRFSEGEAASLEHRRKSAVSERTDNVISDIHRLVAQETNEILNSLDIVRGRKHPPPVQESFDTGPPAADLAETMKKAEDDTKPDKFIASEQGTPPAPTLSRRKVPSKVACQAFRIHKLAGFSQQITADQLTQAFKRPIDQGMVSRWVNQVAEFVEAGGVLTPIEDCRPKVVTGDPSRLDLGARTDPRKARPSDIRRQDDNSD